MKTCTKCLEPKDDSEFYVRRASKDGLALKCKACCKAYYDATYPQPEFKQKAKDKAKKWAAENKDARKKIVAKSAAKNRGTKAASSKLYRERMRLADPEKARLSYRMAAARRRARIKAVGGGATAEQARLVICVSRSTCTYCGRPCQKITIDHLDPVAKGGSLGWENLVGCCLSCNSSKNDGDAAEWIYDRHGAEGLARCLIFLKCMRKVMKRRS